MDTIKVPSRKHIKTGLLYGDMTNVHKGGNEKRWSVEGETVEKTRKGLYDAIGVSVHSGYAFTFFMLR